MTDISRYLDFVLTMFFAFGAAFEVPVVTVLLVWTGLVTQDGLRQKRPYVIVGAFVFGMLLTPPDVISQTLLALPVLLLFELGIVFSGWFVAHRNQDGSGDADSKNGDSGQMTEAEMDAELDRIEADEEKP